MLEKGLDAAAAEESQTVTSCHCPSGKGDATSKDDEKPKPANDEGPSDNSGEENEEGKDASGLGHQH